MAESMAFDADDVRAWRADYEERLREDWGWLTVTGLHWIDDGSWLLGSAPGADLPMNEAPDMPARAVNIIRNGQEVNLEVLAPGSVLRGGAPAQSGPLKFSGTQGDRFIIGRQSFLVVRTPSRVGVRTWDNGLPKRSAFDGSDWFGPDAAWVAEAEFVPFGELRAVPYQNALGEEKEVKVTGEWQFALEGERFAFIALSAEGDEPFFVFRDGTAGRETYGASRFLQGRLLGEGRALLDFNRAYNPPCAFTPHATCPLAPRQNVMGLPVRAGEKLYRGPGSTS